MTRLFALAGASLGLALAPTSAIAAEEVGAHSPNMTHVMNIPYEARNGQIPNYGTDIEFGRLRGRQYAFAGSYRNGLHIVDINKPAQAKVVGIYDCGVSQGDVQVFRRRGRTYVTYTSDTYGDGTSTCYREAEALGFQVKKENGTGRNGTFIADVTNPRRPRTVSFVEVPQGSHNMTVHPSGNYLYNSNSDLITSYSPAIEVFDITNFRAPRPVTELSLPTRPGLGTESHDITFNEKGTRGYSAALSQGVIIDTEDPADPKIVTSFLDPAINVWHQSDPFTLRDKGGNLREFLIAEDEVAGAEPTGQCPNGGVHIYEITGDLEKSPRKVGYWNIDELRNTDQVDGRCTAHVLDIHEQQQVMTIAYYNGGVRVVDISGLAGIALGSDQLDGAGMRELGFYRPKGADTWSAKTPLIERNGSFYLYGNDVERGLDIYRYEYDAKRSANRGQWLTAEEAEARALSRPRVKLTEETKFFCLLAQ